MQQAKSIGCILKYQKSTLISLSMETANLIDYGKTLVIQVIEIGLKQYKGRLTIF